MVSATPPFARNNLRGVGWMLTSVVFASAMSLAVRGLAAELDSRMVVLLRAAITAVLILAALGLLPRLRAQLSFSRPRQHIVRGALIGVSTHLGFFTLTHIPLATATVLFFTAPIFATLLAMAVHGERVGPRRVLAIAAGFIGAIIVLRPGFVGFELGMVTAIASSLLFAAALTLSRGLAQADGPLATYVSSVMVTALLSVPLAAPVLALPGSALGWGLTAVLVFAGSVRGFADIEAYRWGEAAILAPFAYLRLVILGLAGYLIFDERIDTPTAIGAAIIVTATLYIAHRERRLRRARPVSAAAPPGPSGV